MRRLHLIAAFAATTCIALFWTSTVLVELLGTPDHIRFVKRAIVYGLAVLIPAMALTGITGTRLGAGRPGPAVTTKRRRMPIIAANGLLVLVPVAFYLNHLASSGSMGALFYSLQAIELAAGGANLALMAGNISAGRRLRANG